MVVEPEEDSGTNGEAEMLEENSLEVSSSAAVATDASIKVCIIVYYQGLPYLYYNTIIGYLGCVCLKTQDLLYFTVLSLTLTR